MGYYGHTMGTGWTLIMFAVVLPVLILAAGLIIAQLRPGPAGPAAPDREPHRDAERILDDRLARGEIGTDEYELRLHTLRAGHRPPR